MPCGKIPKGYKKATQFKHTTGHSERKSSVEADRSFWNMAGYKTRIVQEAGIYQLVVKKR